MPSETKLTLSALSAIRAAQPLPQPWLRFRAPLNYGTLSDSFTINRQACAKIYTRMLIPLIAITM